MEQKLTMGDVTLNVVDEGAGEPLLLVHGFPLNHTMWQSQIQALSSQCRVIAPDLRGFGHSSVTEGTVSMEQFADDLNRLLDELSVREPIRFCGLSMGGYIGWAFLRKYADRLRSVILCDTKAAADSPEAAENRRQMAEQVLRDGPESLAENLIPKLFAETTAENQPAVVEKVRLMIHGTDARGIAAALWGMAERPDSTEQLPQIEVPTLLIVGEEDQLTTVAEMSRMAEAMPAAELVDVPRAGHMAPMEQPERVNQAIRRFCESHKPRV